MYFVVVKIEKKETIRNSTISGTLLLLERRACSVQEFHALKVMPPQLEWYAKIRSDKT